MLAASSDQAVGKVYNLGSEEVISLKDLAALLVEVNGSGQWKCVPFTEELKKIDIGDYYGDFRKIEAELGWQPTVCLREGLQRSLQFYRRHGKEYWE